MFKKLLESKKSIIYWLLGAYIAGVALRFCLAQLTSQNPFIMPDEALYANLARSIADGAGIALRNQPVTYTNLLYSLLIAPVYALFKAGAQFRMIQLFNCLAMNLAVFPAYGIAKRFTSRKTAFGIALITLVVPDMIMTTHIMTEAIVYPLFLLTVYLMFSFFDSPEPKLFKVALTGLSVYLLYQAKSGSAALAAVFFIILVIEFLRCRRKSTLYYTLVYTGVFAGLMLLIHFVLKWAGMDFAQQTLYETQTQMPTLIHLKQTLPGLLLYAFFIPIAFGIYPLLLPATNIKRFEPQQRKQLILTLAALILYAAGACYMFFDTETIGNFFAGRIHIRYVFMFLPVLLCFMFSPALEKAKPNGWLLLLLGFLLAMTITVSFEAHLSGRKYPVDAISLSYLTHDDAVFNWGAFSQIAAVTFAMGVLVLLYRRGFGRLVRRVVIVCLLLGLTVSNWLGYDLNDYNNSKALKEDSAQCAQAVSGEDTLLAYDSGIYFDNTLSVLDISMADAPYVMSYDDLCAALGDYGELTEAVPKKYWTEKPTNAVRADSVVFTSSAFNKMVIASGVQTSFTDSGYYGIVHLPESKRLFHSAL